jgi:hypothetical protein
MECMSKCKVTIFHGSPIVLALVAGPAAADDVAPVGDRPVF